MEKVSLFKKNNVIYVYVLLGEHLINSYQCPITTRKLDDIPYFRERLQPKFQEYLEKSYVIEVDNDKPNLRLLLQLLDPGKKYKAEISNVFNENKNKLHIRVVNDDSKALLFSEKKFIVSDLYTFLLDLIEPPLV
jgi:hypothetical protein